MEEHGAADDDEFIDLAEDVAQTIEAGTLALSPLSVVLGATDSVLEATIASIPTIGAVVTTLLNNRKFAKLTRRIEALEAQLTPQEVAAIKAFDAGPESDLLDDVLRMLADSPADASVAIAAGVLREVASGSGAPTAVLQTLVDAAARVPEAHLAALAGLHELELSAGESLQVDGTNHDDVCCLITELLGDDQWMQAVLGTLVAAGLLHEHSAGDVVDGGIELVRKVHLTELGQRVAEEILKTRDATAHQGSG